MTLGARTHGASAGTPVVVAIGGLDSSGGSGLVRDFLTAHTLGARVVLVPTAWTIQQGAGLQVKISLRPADDARQDVLSVLAGLPAAGVAVKVGMLGSPAVMAAVLAALRGVLRPPGDGPGAGHVHRPPPVQRATVRPRAADGAGHTGYTQYRGSSGSFYQ